MGTGAQRGRRTAARPYLLTGVMYSIKEVIHYCLLCSFCVNSPTFIFFSKGARVIKGTQGEVVSNRHCGMS